MLTRVMVAGIGGASLGTELIKALSLASTYDVFGCDVSPLAYGHAMVDTCRTFVVDRDRYVESVLAACKKAGAALLIPGGEQPMVLLGRAKTELEAGGVTLVGNDQAVVERFSDKAETFVALRQLGVPIPETRAVESSDDLAGFPFPAIVKPATGTGGSAFVFLAVTPAEAALYVTHLRQNGQKTIVQAYIPDDEGEFTIGVLSLPSGHIVGSVALRRLFHTKLSVHFRSAHGVISSGYSQGLIDDFPDLRAQAEAIARGIDSRGPINIQARVKNGVLYPFEINPRFSASTYLRALAGFNEIDLFLTHLRTGTIPETPQLRPGYYLRTLAETVVSKDKAEVSA
ncbi:MAG: ATP-grasp domain-containing protein [Candidatus Saccharimonas sp.]|nr:ATP-grasp domain-containing protein [Planctomycetaceae bacterium]